MTPQEQLELVKKHYSLNKAGDFDEAQKLLTDDFSITIPDYMPFAGVYRGKNAFVELIPIVAKSVSVKTLTYVATTVGDDHAVELVEFTLEGGGDTPVEVAEVVWFRGEQISEIRPFYFDPAPFIEAAARNAAKAAAENAVASN
ncbi:nuclear transport factor 2 family protein [Subtercola lobariae]|nr:nuclear transport factor 2 family protein [Subtercola lobariae]